MLIHNRPTNSYLIDCLPTDIVVLLLFSQSLAVSSELVTVDLRWKTSVPLQEKGG